MEDEQPLLGTQAAGPRVERSTSGLNVLHATLSFISLCGVLPIITLPRPVIDCGWLGFPLSILVFGVQIYTALLLGRTWIIAEKIDSSVSSKERYPYAALTESAFGPKPGKFVSLILSLNSFGSGIPNLIIVSKNLQLFFENVAGSWARISYCYWLIALGFILCPFMWLGSPKEMKPVSVVSVCAVVCVAIITCAYMIADPTTPIRPVTSTATWEAVAITYGILSFQFGIHPTILTVQMDMDNKSSIGISLFYSFMVMGFLFFMTTVTATFKYGVHTEYNLLESLPKGFPLYCDILMVMLQITLSMVLGGSAMFQDIETRLGVPSEFGWKRCVTRSFIVFLAVLVGELLPRFDLIMGLVGGALSSPLIFFLPPLLYTRFRALEDLHFHVDKSPMSSRTGHQAVLPGTSREDIPDELNLSSNKSSHKTPAIQTVVNFIRSLKNWRYLFDDHALEEPVTRYEQFIMYAIMVLGTVATISATVFSIRNAVIYAKHSVPACL